MEKSLSVVIPAYNEEGMIEKTTAVLSNILNEEKIKNELIFIDVYR